jgi:hypothetical protein
LYAHTFTASDRIVDHTTFSEIQWRRDVFSPHSFVVPHGFQSSAYLFSDEFLEVLKDVHALKCMRDSPIFKYDDTASMVQMDNHQGWIQSRLCELPEQQFIQECCRLAAYLCASTLCCKIWRTSVMPVSEMEASFMRSEVAPLTHLPISLILRCSSSEDCNKDPPTRFGMESKSC